MEAILGVLAALGIGIPTIWGFIRSTFELNLEIWAAAGDVLDRARREIWQRRHWIFFGSLAYFLLTIGLIIIGVAIQDKVIARVFVATGGMMQFIYFVILLIAAERVAALFEVLVRLAHTNAGFWAGLLKSVASLLNLDITVPLGTTPQPGFVNAVRGLRAPIISALGMLVLLVVFPYKIAAVVILPIIFVVYVLAFMANTWGPEIIDTVPMKKFTYKLVSRAIPAIIIMTLLGTVMFPKTTGKIGGWMARVDNMLGADDPAKPVTDLAGVKVKAPYDLAIYDATGTKTDKNLPAREGFMPLPVMTRAEYENGQPLKVIQDDFDFFLQISRRDQDTGRFVDKGERILVVEGLLEQLSLEEVVSTLVIKPEPAIDQGSVVVASAGVARIPVTNAAGDTIFVEATDEIKIQNKNSFPVFLFLGNTTQCKKIEADAADSWLIPINFPGKAVVMVETSSSAVAGHTGVIGKKNGKWNQF